MNGTIVFIHIGPKLPDYLNIALQQARLFNPQAVIILVTSAAAIINSPIKRKLNIEVVPCEALGISQKHKRFLKSTNLDKQFRQGFWLHTTERFFYLETLMLKHKLTDVIHLENDIMLYVKIAAILPTLQAHYPGIAATFDAPDRCVPGFVYIRNGVSLSSFTEFTVNTIQQSNPNYNDMTLLALYKKQYNSSAIAPLPIISTNYAKPLQNQLGCPIQKAKNYNNNFNKFESVFDAAAIGQFLGGIDPANNKKEEDTKGFINETSVFDPSVYTYNWIINYDGLKIPIAINNFEIIKINNLHIHSKALDNFCSSKQKSTT